MLTDQEKETADRPLTLDELTTAVRSLKRNKTLDADGLSPEVACALWNIIGSVLLRAFNYSLEEKLLYLSSRRGIISLIPKKDRDGKLIKNWRPLTLLNTDFEILAKIISLRIKPYLFLEKLIHSNQTGFMANRNIAHNVRKIIDIITFAEHEKVNAIVLSLDFEKDFDRVERCAIKGTLQYFNFGDVLI